MSLCQCASEKYESLNGVDFFAAVARDFLKIEIKVLTLYASFDHVMATNAAAVQFNANGLSVSPCAVPVNLVGVNLDHAVSSPPSV